MHDFNQFGKNYWQLLTSLVLEVQVVSIREEPGLQVETKKKSLYFDLYAVLLRFHTQCSAIITLQHVRA